jgi:tRNA/rRNA methyltransferase
VPEWRPPRIVLIRPRNPLNIGAAARAMANFGFEDLVLVQPYTRAFQEARSARAGVSVLQQARCFATLHEAIADCTYVIGTTAGTLRTPAIELEDWITVAAGMPTDGTAILFGSEKTGLSVDDISYCRRLARIPTVPDKPSMNLGQAVAVCTYELIRNRYHAAATSLSRGRDPASVIDRERIVTLFVPILEQIGVFLPAHRSGQTRRLRTMLTRWQLTAADARLLLGLARELSRVLGLRRIAQGGTIQKTK